MSNSPTSVVPRFSIKCNLRNSFTLIISFLLSLQAIGTLAGCTEDLCAGVTCGQCEKCDKLDGVCYTTCLDGGTCCNGACSMSCCNGVPCHEPNCQCCGNPQAPCEGGANQCCPTGNGLVCTAGTQCGTEHCCAGEICCGGECHPPGTTCCGDGGACPAGSECCAGGCLKQNTTVQCCNNKLCPGEAQGGRCCPGPGGKNFCKTSNAKGHCCDENDCTLRGMKWGVCCADGPLAGLCADKISDCYPDPVA